MPVYVQFTKLTEGGRLADRIGKGAQEINQKSNYRLEEMGAKLLHQYALLGPYDFVNIIEAPNQDVITALATEINGMGMASTVTMPANSIPDLKSIVEQNL